MDKLRPTFHDLDASQTVGTNVREHPHPCHTPSFILCLGEVRPFRDRHPNCFTRCIEPRVVDSVHVLQPTKLGARSGLNRRSSTPERPPGRCMPSDVWSQKAAVVLPREGATRNNRSRDILRASPCLDSVRPRLGIRMDASCLPHNSVQI